MEFVAFHFRPFEPDGNWHSESKKGRCEKKEITRERQKTIKIAGAKQSVGREKSQ